MTIDPTLLWHNPGVVLLPVRGAEKMTRMLMAMMAVSLVVVACSGGTSADPCEGNTCSGHGTCSVDNDQAICNCDEGYTGDLCADTDPCEGITCSGHGTCAVADGEAVCVCDEGYGGDLCAECGAGYHEEGESCVVNEVCDADSCSGHGVCVNLTGVVVCDCDKGHEGNKCELCEPGYQDRDADGACLPDCPTLGLDCGPHGACDDSSGLAACDCDVGYAGTYCDACAPDYEDLGSGCVLFWISIPGGTFMMGSDTGNADEQPVHEVTVPSFEMNRFEVTVMQYQECVDDWVCTEPNDYTGDEYCNWGQAGREDHPVNCVDWFQAVVFCSWVGGRLPSEAEWEYAARGGGQDITYPWGDQSPTCEYAVMNDGGYGCLLGRTWSVCRKTAGNTAQGLCDMAGNVWEWVQDWWHWGYNGAPSDGSAWEIPSGSNRVLRGGSFGNDGGYLRTAYRTGGITSARYGGHGFRCAR